MGMRPYSIPLSLSCSWDLNAIKESARIAAIEASADGICWTFSPMLDISRDPRWGRMSEGNGEDPYLDAQIAKAMVQGYQGNDLKANNTIMSLLCLGRLEWRSAPETRRGLVP